MDVQIIKATDAEITVEMVQESSPPMTGNYRITCPDPEGNDVSQGFTTDAIDPNSNGYWTMMSLAKCPGILNKV